MRAERHRVAEPLGCEAPDSGRLHQFLKGSVHSRFVAPNSRSHLRRSRKHLTRNFRFTLPSSRKPHFNLWCGTLPLECKDFWRRWPCTGQIEGRANNY